MVWSPIGLDVWGKMCLASRKAQCVREKLLRLSYIDCGLSLYSVYKYEEKTSSLELACGVREIQYHLTNINHTKEAYTFGVKFRCSYTPMGTKRDSRVST